MVATNGDIKKLAVVRDSVDTFDIVCFSHLRWDLVYQRPHHILTRFGSQRRVYYLEEPEIESGTAWLEYRIIEAGVQVAVPHIPPPDDREDFLASMRKLVDQLLADKKIHDFVAWYYTPMALSYSDHLQPKAVVYDCIDELSAFNGAPEVMELREKDLLKRADLVFTGGASLFQSKRDLHKNVHAFPSSIDRLHFNRARQIQEDPADQANIPHPRLGYFGVLDERIDYGLLEQVAEARPDWQIVLVGPLAKVEKEDLPERANIHYLGKKDYKSLPTYLAGWDVAILPFAQNESTRYISPTKTSEYLAGGKRVVSTPIQDVVQVYGVPGLVEIADGCQEFIQAVDSCLQRGNRSNGWLRKVDKFLSTNSWDETQAQMEKLLLRVVSNNLITKVNGNGKHQPEGNGSGIPSNGKSRQEIVAPARASTKKVFDYLIVGAGFAGSVLAERLARGSGKKVLLIDKRNHIAGNAYDYHDESGILIHKYGPHIFHTNSREVYAYLSQFTQWRPYEHRVLASVDGQLVPIPINLDTVNKLYGLSLTSFELEKFFASLAEPIENVRTSEDVVVSKVGRQLYEKFFRNYTRKQWGLDPSELDAAVTSRVPVRLNRDDRYFGDTFQSMPLHGYTRMFENMLDHPNIKIMVNTDYHEIIDFVGYREMIFTGPVDEYFDFCYGKLPYRSLQFVFQTLDKEVHQPVAVVNYPNDHLFTRVTEFKYLTGQQHNKTSIVFEYPCSEGDPYYPIPRPENAELYKKYKELADSTAGVHFAGRLGTYRYYNMDQVTGQALTLYARISGQKRSEALQAYQPAVSNIFMPCPILTVPEVEA